MIKKLINLVSAVLAINFLIVAGGVGYLVYAGKIDKEKVDQIRELISMSGEEPATQPTTQEAQELPPATPMMRLDMMLAEASNRPASEKIATVQTAFDAQTAILERRAREIEDQRRQLTQAKADFESQLKILRDQAEALRKQQQEQAKLAEDKGFQDTLSLYRAMPPKKTKDLFMTLDEDVVVRYLQSMEPRIASGILKEFKTPDESSRAQRILEKMRLANAKAE